MSFTVEEDSPFPADDGLFADTFSQDIDYTLWGQQLRIKQLFGANLGVASTVWDAVSLQIHTVQSVRQRVDFLCQLSYDDGAFVLGLFKGCAPVSVPGAAACRAEGEACAGAGSRDWSARYCGGSSR